MLRCSWRYNVKVFLLIDKNFEGDVGDLVEGVTTDAAVAQEWTYGDMGFDVCEYELDEPALIERIKTNTGPLRLRNQR